MSAPGWRFRSKNRPIVVLRREMAGAKRR
jgi:hypothetical protein